MAPRDAAEFTTLLIAWRAGDQDALERLTEIAYDELRRLAVARLRREGRGQVPLQPTELINEMFLRLLSADVSWQDRAHFYTVAATTMRRVLVDQARARQRHKRGPDALKITLEDWHQDGASSSTTDTTIDMLALHQALQALEGLDPQQAWIVELYFFAGLTYDEIARLTERSRSAVHRLVRSGQAWLFNQLHQQPEPGTS
ncbi:MAG: ECF-type sigma factor [Acidobacteriota bacterium]